MDGAGLELADRIRALLPADPGLAEKRMFGTRAFLLGGRILAGARPGGVLLVRLSPERSAILAGSPGASRAVMGAKTMSTGWVDVQPQAIATDEALLEWLDAAREDALAAG